MTSPNWIAKIFEAGSRPPPPAALRAVFAMVWLVNGLAFKVLDWVPRHSEIVARILGETRAHPITLAIGWAEVLFAVWIFSGIRWRLSCLLQIAAVAAMNVIEFALARDLLLFGGWNAAVAAAYCGLVFWSGFIKDWRHEAPDR